MSDQSNPLLEVKELSKRFYTDKSNSPVLAINKINLSLGRNESLGLVGGSGSGKSTLARCILKLIPVSSGRMFFKGVEYTTANATVMKPLRKSMQMVFQESSASLNPRMSLEELLIEPYRIHNLHRGLSRNEELNCVRRLMEQCGLGRESLSKYPHEFSGGQRQRIGIARALAVEPELLILDEPVSSLDLSVQAQILNLLKDLRQEFGLSYLFISHDIRVVRFMCERIMILNRGEIVEEGLTEEVLQLPKAHYSKALFRAAGL